MSLPINLCIDKKMNPQGPVIPHTLSGCIALLWYKGKHEMHTCRDHKNAEQGQAYSRQRAVTL